MAPIEFDLQPSKILLFILLFLLLSFIIFIFLLPIHFVFQLIFQISIAIYYCHLIKSLGLSFKKTHYFKFLNSVLMGSNNAPSHIIKIWQTLEGRFGIQTATGQKFFITLLSDSFISTYMIILRIKRQHKNLTLIICKDSLQKGEYKILCARILLSSLSKYQKRQQKIKRSKIKNKT